MAKPTKVKSDLFKRNLRLLIERRGISQRQLAVEAGVPERWLRRLCSKGLCRWAYGEEAAFTFSRLHALLRTLCPEVYRFMDTDLLWHEDIECRLLADTEPSDEWLKVAVERLRVCFAESQHSRYLRNVLRAIDTAYAAAIQSAALEDTEGQTVCGELPASRPHPEDSRNQLPLEKFRENIQHLLAVSGLNRPEFARLVNVPVRWMRHICYVGLPKPPRPDSLSDKRLRALCKHFAINNSSVLWTKDLAVSIKKLPQSTDDLLEKTIYKLKTAYEELGRSPELCRVRDTLKLFHSSRAEACDQFKLNIRSLVKERNLPLKSSAEEIGVPYCWLRHLYYNGLTKQTRSSRVGQRNDDSVDRISLVCFYFGITNKYDLWDSNLEDGLTKRLLRMQSRSNNQFMQRTEYQELVQRIAGCSDEPEKATQRMHTQTKAMLGDGTLEAEIISLYNSVLVNHQTASDITESGM